MPNKPNVFLSHSSKDKGFVRELDRALHAHRIDTCLDERDIGLGEDIPSWIYSSIEEASHVCYVISKNSIHSRWVKDELSKASMIENERRGVFVLPILIDDSDVPITVRNKRYADFSNELDKPIHETSGFRLLLAALGFDVDGYKLKGTIDKIEALNLAQNVFALFNELRELRIRAEQLYGSAGKPSKWRRTALVYERMMDRTPLLLEKMKQLVVDLNDIASNIKEGQLEHNLALLQKFHKELITCLDTLPSDDQPLSEDDGVMEQLLEKITLFEGMVNQLSLSLLYLASVGRPND